MIKLSRNAVIVAALLTSTAALAEDSGWSISEADGQVSIIRDSKAIYGAKGTELQIGDVVTTSKSGRAVLIRGKEFVLVSPNAKVQIKKVEETGALAQVLDYLGDVLTPGSTKLSRKQPTLAAVVKGYDGDSKDNEVLAAAHARMSLAPEE